jgi:hypothetical protein
MTANAKLAQPAKGDSLFVRPKFSPGLLLQDEDLNSAVDYVRDVQRVMLRTLFGCGVVCGLVVEATEKCGKLNVIVNKGVAIDCLGDLVQVCKTQTLVVEACEPCDPTWVILRRTERCCAPRTAICAPDDDDGSAVCTRIKDGFEIRLLCDEPDCLCRCHPKPAAAPPADTPPVAEPSGEVVLARETGGSHRRSARPHVRANMSQAVMEQATTEPPAPTEPHEHCACVDPDSECYRNHYAAICECCCESEWILLAKVYKGPDPEHPTQTAWFTEHSVRRFVRPVLMRDPRPELDRHPAKPT